MLRRNSPDDPGLTSLHRLEFYKRKKDWRLEREKSPSPDHSLSITRTIKRRSKLRPPINWRSKLSQSKMASFSSQRVRNMDKDRSKGERERRDVTYCSDVNRTYSVLTRSESMGRDSRPSSSELRDLSLARSCSFTSLLDTDILSGSFLTRHSLEDLTDEVTFQAEVWERPHSSHLDVSQKLTYASVAAKIKGDIQSSDQTTTNQQRVDQSHSSADKMAFDPTVSDQNVSPFPGKNRWNKHNKNNTKEKTEGHQPIRYSKDALHRLNQNDKHFISGDFGNSSNDPHSKIKVTSAKCDTGIASYNGEMNLTQTKDDCEASKNDVLMAWNDDAPNDICNQTQDKEILECENEVMPKNYPTYTVQTKDDPRFDRADSPKNDYPMSNYYSMQTNDYPNTSVPKYDDSDFIGYYCDRSITNTKNYDVIPSIPPGFELNERQNMKMDDTRGYPMNENIFGQENNNFGNNCNDYPMASEVNQSCFYNDKPQFVWDNNNNEISSLNVGPRFTQMNANLNIYSKDFGNLDFGYRTTLNNDMPAKEVFGNTHQTTLNNQIPPKDRFGNSHQTTLNNKMPPKDIFGNSHQTTLNNQMPPKDIFGNSHQTTLNNQMPPKDIFGNSHQTTLNNQMPPKDIFGNSHQTTLNNQMRPKDIFGSSHQITLNNQMPPKEIFGNSHQTTPNNQMPPKDIFGNNHQTTLNNQMPPKDIFGNNHQTTLNNQMPPKDIFGNSHQTTLNNQMPPKDIFGNNHQTTLNNQMPPKDIFGNSHQTTLNNQMPPKDIFGNSYQTTVNSQVPPKEVFGNSYQNGGISVPPGFKTSDRFSRYKQQIYEKSSFTNMDKPIENPHLSAPVCPNTHLCPNENHSPISFQRTEYHTSYPQYGQCNTLNGQNFNQFECINSRQRYANLTKKVIHEDCFNKTTLKYGDSEISYINEYRTTLVQPVSKDLHTDAVHSCDAKNLPHMYQAFPNQPQLWPVERYNNGIGLGRGRARKDWINNPGFARYKGYPC